MTKTAADKAAVRSLGDALQARASPYKLCYNYVFRQKEGRTMCALFVSLFLHICGNYLGDIGSVVGSRAVILVGNAVIGDEAALLHIIGIELAADEYEVSLAERDTVSEHLRSKSGSSYLVAVFSGVSSAVGESLSVFLTEE